MLKGGKEKEAFSISEMNGMPATHPPTPALFKKLIIELNLIIQFPKLFSATETAVT
jgi:hypothetical protein